MSSGVAPPLRSTVEKAVQEYFERLCERIEGPPYGGFIPGHERPAPHHIVFGLDRCNCCGALRPKA